jgi:hypothetical protein
MNKISTAQTNNEVTRKSSMIELDLSLLSSVVGGVGPDVVDLVGPDVVDG